VQWAYDYENIFAGNRDPCPAVTRGFTAWPPPGVLPHVLIYPRWHISTEGLTTEGALRNASVAMTCNGAAISISVLRSGAQTFGSFIVWEPRIGSMPSDWRSWILNSTVVLPALSSGDYSCTVQVSNVPAERFGGNSTISYDVTIYLAAGSLTALSAPEEVSASAATADSNKPGGFGFLGPAPKL